MPQKVSLDGKWKLVYFPEGKFKVKNPEELSKIKAKMIEAQVPGNVELDLVKAGELPDPFFGDNIFKLRPYESYEWWYKRSFQTPANIDKRYVRIVFHGLDCFTTIWVNGQRIGETANMLIEHSFDITSLLRQSEINELVVKIKSSINVAKKYQYKPSCYAGATNFESLYVRKAPHMYGWDIAPRVVSAGIWRSVDLELHESTEITDFYYFTQEIKGEDVVLGICWQFTTDEREIDGFSLRFIGKCGESRFEHISPCLFTAGFTKIKIPNAKLWWPKGYGEPNLYSITCELLKGDKVMNSRDDKIGLRKVELVRTDITTSTNPGEFLFRCNGIPIMCKGSNWVPADAFHSRDADRYERILRLFDDLNCNILRCWGGNVYEDDTFYDLCDQMGIMVWQDFAFACAMYPQDEKFLKIVSKEAKSILKKLRNHPSIILWCGDNECDVFYSHFSLDPGTNRITREVLPRACFTYDPFRPYLPSSPYMSPEVAKAQNENTMPEQHLWGPRDYYKSRFYTETTAHFVSEIGYHGCPNIASIRKFIEPKYLWPWQNNPQWRAHCTDSVPSGGPYQYRVKLMADQIKELFGFIPENLEDFVLASQISQAEAKKFFIEMFRIKKWRKTGIIWWNMIDCWPQFSDAIVDYYFGRKLAYWYIKRAQQPVCIMMDEPRSWNCRVIVGNDSLRAASGVYSILDANTKTILMEGKFIVEANTNLEIGKIRISHSEHRLFLIEWTIDGIRYGNHYLLGKPPISFEQYKKWLKQIAGLPISFNVDEIGK